MTKPEFKKAFKELHARYPGFVMPEPEAVCDIWFEDMKRFSLGIFRRSLPLIVDRCPAYFPGAGMVVQIVESVLAESIISSREPRARYEPYSHGCNLQQGRTEVQFPRKLLYMMEPYEGLHVTCHSSQPFIPRCPWCGIEIAPFVNTFISMLMEKYPDQTECWNAWHKGLQLCGRCEGLRWPQDFTGRRQQ